jgi:hypothetical protein
MRYTTMLRYQQLQKLWLKYKKVRLLSQKMQKRWRRTVSKMWRLIPHVRGVSN